MEEGHEHTRKKLKISDETETVDRISNLPDAVIHHILSLMDAKDAVQTCVLSKKWKFHWAHIPCYIFSCSTTSTTTGSVIGFEDFVISVLNNRRPFNVSRPRFRISAATMPSLVKILYRYAMSYRSEQLDVRNKVQISDKMVVMDRLSSLPDPIIHHILSLTDTKSAVQTCVLSKKWRDHWTNIHSLNFDRSSFGRWVGFKNFVLHVLQHRKSLDLGNLRFICGGTIKVQLVKKVFLYAKSHRIEGLDSDLIGSFPQRHLSCQQIISHECENLRTLKIYHMLTDFSEFANLTTLEISASLPADTDVLFSRCLNLETLVLVNCRLYGGITFIISSPRLVTVTISSFTFCRNIVITAQRLKFLNLKEEIPYSLTIDNRLAIEKVYIHMSPPVNCQILTTLYASELRDMVESCWHAKSIKVLFSISKENGEERLVFSFDRDQLVNVLEEIITGKKSHTISNQMEFDPLTNLPYHIIQHILSFMDTKDAVRTCVLSKKWRYQWMYIHSLNLYCRSNRITDFKKFVLAVLDRREPFSVIVIFILSLNKSCLSVLFPTPLYLNRLRFYLGYAKSQPLIRIISSYALSKGVEELHTDLTSFPPSFFQCQTLRTLKLAHCSTELPDLSGLPLLTTLELTRVQLPNDCDNYFSRCSVLENLSLILCRVTSSTALKISAPRLVKLTVSCCFNFSERNISRKIVITTPRLIFFKLEEMDPIALSMFDCSTLEKVDIRFLFKPCQKADDHKKQISILDMLHMLQEFFHLKSLKISLEFPKDKFILCRNSIDGETKIAVLDRENGVQELVGLAN
ncbi:hypothetical protein ACOSQ4_004204 [Xanthoceras sorbifolium]